MYELIELQRAIANNRFTLPVVGVFCVLIWLFLSHDSDMTPVLGGLAISLCAVYLIAELNNRNSLLRNGSRLLSTFAFIILTIIPALHPLSTGLFLMLFYVNSYFFLFQTTRIKSPLLTFLIYVTLSIASLLFPKLLYVVPTYWIAQLYMKSFSQKCFVASILGIIVPYWIAFAIYLYLDDYTWLMRMIDEMASNSVPDYSAITLQQFVQFIYLVCLLAVGIVDFYKNNTKDKARVRFIYTVVIFQSLFLVLFILWLPQHFYTLMPLLVVDSAIIGGHFYALTYTKYSAIASVIFVIFTVAVFLLPYLPAINI